MHAVRATFLDLPAATTADKTRRSLGCAGWLPAPSCRGPLALVSGAPDGAASPHGSAVAIDGSHADQGGDLLAVQRAQFRQVRQERQRELFPTPATERSRSSISCHTRLRCSVYGRPSSSSLSSCSDQVMWAWDAGTHRRDGSAEPVSLRRQHGQHLVASGGHGVQLLGVVVSQLSHRRTHCLGEMGQNLGIQGTGFGQQSGGLGLNPPKG